MNLETLKALKVTGINGFTSDKDITELFNLAQEGLENRKYKIAIQNCVNARETGWGERAEIAFDYLYDALS